MPFDVLTPDTPPAEPTRAELAAREVELLKLRTSASLAAFVDSINDGRKHFWSNASGITPGEMAEALGTDCAALFQKNAATEAHLQAIYPNAWAKLWQPPYADFDIAPQGDGRIVITPKPTVPDEPPLAVEPTPPPKG